MSFKRVPPLNFITKQDTTIFLNKPLSIGISSTLGSISETKGTSAGDISIQSIGDVSSKKGIDFSKNNKLFQGISVVGKNSSWVKKEKSWLDIDFNITSLLEE